MLMVPVMLKSACVFLCCVGLMSTGACRDRQTNPPAEVRTHTASPLTNKMEVARMETGTPGDWKRFTKPDEKTLRSKLTPLQFTVTQEEGTEPPFKNEYENNHREGIYVDIVSGEPLFSSRDKFDSGTGWPSFTKPLEPGNIVEKTDRSLFTTRTEVRSRLGNSHLGHVFPDGPKPTGLRYCMNSAALRFIPKEDLAKEGYGEYAEQFTQP